MKQIIIISSILFLLSACGQESSEQKIDTDTKASSSQEGPQVSPSINPETINPSDQSSIPMT